MNGNVNGDFVTSNDLAFVFDPRDEKYGEGITKILDHPDPDAGLKEYLRRSIG
jgi:hypothetical protein